MCLKAWESDIFSALKIARLRAGSVRRYSQREIWTTHILRWITGDWISKYPKLLVVHMDPEWSVIISDSNVIKRNGGSVPQQDLCFALPTFLVLLMQNYQFSRTLTIFSRKTATVTVSETNRSKNMNELNQYVWCRCEMYNVWRCLKGFVIRATSLTKLPPGAIPAMPPCRPSWRDHPGGRERHLCWCERTLQEVVTWVDKGSEWSW